MDSAVGPQSRLDCAVADAAAPVLQMDNDLGRCSGRSGIDHIDPEQSAHWQSRMCGHIRDFIADTNTVRSPSRHKMCCRSSLVQGPRAARATTRPSTSRTSGFHFISRRLLSVFKSGSRQTITLHVIRQRTPLLRQLLIGALRDEICRRPGGVIAFLSEPTIFLGCHEFPTLTISACSGGKPAKVAATRQAPGTKLRASSFGV
jgi:hypothetical protein